MPNRLKEAAKQRIYLLSTGGTIEKVYSEQTGAVVNDESKIERYLQRLRLPATEVIVTHVMNKDSLDMTDVDREQVYLAVLATLGEPAPIVISHGTDTMVQTGRYLEPRLPRLGVPIILTGAMTPLGFEGTDALQNLTESLIAARLLQAGIHVVMHSQIFPIRNVRKDRALAQFVWTGS
jgi:L-asparaginase